MKSEKKGFTLIELMIVISIIGVLVGLLTPMISNAQKNAMEPVYMRLNPGASTEEDFPHEGEEFGYVLKGKIVLVLGKRRLKVKKGESFYFNSSLVHSIENNSQEAAEFIWVSSPPSF